MKNLTRKLLILLCALTLAFAFTACGKSDDADQPKSSNEDTKDDDAEEPAEDDADDSDDASDIPASGKFASLEDFINSDMMKEQMDAQLASLEGTGITAALAAEDNKLIYNFTIEDPELSAVMDAAALETSLNSQAETFESIASVIPAAVEVENPVVVVRYLDNTGAEIISKEFAPQE